MLPIYTGAIISQSGGYIPPSTPFTLTVGGPGANDANNGQAGFPVATIQRAMNLAGPGDRIGIHEGEYPETIIPPTSGTSGNPITIEAYPNETVVITGLNTADGGWTIHTGNIYKKNITLPNANNFVEDTGGSNTVLMANQVFKDGTMQHLARWPKVSTPEDLLDKTKFRPLGSVVSFGATSVVDNGLPSIPGGLAGAYISMNGWFLTQTRQITSHSGNTLNYSTVIAINGEKFRKFYYLTGKLGLLTQAREWHYESGVLYFWQEGGGSPTGVEYKARNWGFDLRGKSNITIKGLQFIGCDPVTSNSASTNITVANIRATYINHSFLQSDAGNDYTRSAVQAGIKLLGANSVIKDSEIAYAGAHGIWLGPNCRAENNLMHDMIYDGMWGAPLKPWGADDGQVMTRNTIYRTGRGAVELHGGGVATLNMDISYNDISMFNMLSIDGGAVYSGLNTDLTGTRVHHNWFHDTGVTRVGGVDGVQVTGVYLDQGSGPVTMDHNVHWNGDECDYYAEIKNYARDNGGSKLYNNTFFGTTDRSYITYAVPAAADVQKNNIYGGDLSSPNFPLDVTNAIYKATNPIFVVSGGVGLDFRIQTSSPAKNAGVVIPGITDGYIGAAPDIGAYEFGGEDWVPGYVAVPLDP